MKARPKLLSDFINDFNLEAADQSVCFIAHIVFSAKNVSKEMYTEIHLVTLPITGNSIFYLLDPAISFHGIPDIIPYQVEQYLYTKNNFLTINGISAAHGLYTMNIFPTGRICYPGTETELRKKANN